MTRMGYVTKLQVIKRANDTRQFYVICPAPLAQALEMEPGEENKGYLLCKRDRMGHLIQIK